MGPRERHCSECKQMVLVPGQATDGPLPFCDSPLARQGFLAWDAVSCIHFVESEITIGERRMKLSMIENPVSGKEEGGNEQTIR